MGVVSMVERITPLGWDESGVVSTRPRDLDISFYLVTDPRRRRALFGARFQRLDLQREKRHYRRGRGGMIILGSGLEIEILEGDLDLLVGNHGLRDGFGEGILLRTRGEVHSQVYGYCSHFLSFVSCLILFECI
jgi:hypothetical protein